MSTKKLQILDSMIKQAENANTLGGRSASYFAAAHDVNALHTLVGDTSVSTQISTAVEAITADDLGVYVQDTEPTEAVEGDIWIDSGADSSNYIPINHVHNDATASASGFMSALDKAAIDNLNTLVGDTSVSEQINNAIDELKQDGTVVAGKLSTARAISLTGDVTGTADFDGSAGIAINTTVSASKYYSATFTSSGWSSSAPFTQTVSVSGIKASDNPIVDINMSSATSSNSSDLLEAWGLVGRVSTANGSVTAYCYDEKPTVNIPVNIMVVK